MRAFIVMATVLTVPSLTLTAAPEVMSAADAVKQHLLLQSPAPDYPLEARLRHKTGRGVYEMVFDYQTGRLQTVRAVNKIDDEMLNSCVMRTLNQWQAKPKSVHVLRLPVLYRMIAPPSR